MTTLVDYPEVKVQYSDAVNMIAPPDHPISAFGRRQLLCSFRSHACIDFLNSKRPNSVLYISFGSQNTIPALQMIELAKGLEASGRPFLWRRVASKGIPTFQANISQKAQGILLHKWAPQLEILSHASTGAFLSHCGWNSVLERLYEGVPIIDWPLSADQLYTSSMLQDMGAAIEIARGRYFEGLEKGWQGVKDAVEAILDEEKGCGSKMREKVGEIKDVIRAAVREDTGFVGSSCKAMESFLQAIFDG
ncbi:UDP-glycosyltransferase 92A1-like [Carex rostrata]